MLYTHLSSGDGKIGQLVTDNLSGLSLPHFHINKKKTAFVAGKKKLARNRKSTNRKIILL
jgi:hypothetical protein